jgi:hypothetical protein
MQPRALGRKASDEFVVPLCRIHHREVHRAGDERVWWKRAGIDPIDIARKLWSSRRLSTGALPAARAGEGAEPSVTSPPDDATSSAGA